MTNEVKIILTATDKASAVLKGFGANATGSFVEISAALSLIQSGMRTVDKVWDSFIDKPMAYAKQVREIADFTGATTETTQRLIQVADDWGITSDQVRMSMKMLSKNGISPTIDNLAKLADEFVNTTDKEKFAEKASKLLGRQWDTLIPILKNGGQALRDQAAAVNDNLILTEKQIAQARELEVAMDNLSDTWEGFTYQVGPKAIPKITQLLDLFGKLTEIDYGQSAWGPEGQKQLSNFSDIAAEFINKFFYGIPTVKSYTNALEDYGVRARSIVAPAIQEVDDKQQEAARSAEDLANWQEFGGKIAAYTAQHMDEAAGSIRRATSASNKFKSSLERLNEIDLNIADKIGEEIKKMRWEQAGGQIIDQMKTEIERQLQAGLISQTTADKALSTLQGAADGVEGSIQGWDLNETAKTIQTDLGVPFDEAKAKALAIFEAIKQGTLTPYVITIIEKITQQGSSVLKKRVPGHTYYGGGVDAMGASGLSMVVPPGFPGDSFRIGATSGEHVEITPQGKSGNGMTVIQNIFPSPGMDEMALAGLVAERLNKASRLARYAGNGYAG